jgi:hypothetical protein
MNIKLIKLELLLKRHFSRIFQNQFHRMLKKLLRNQNQLLFKKTNRQRSSLKINLLSVVKKENFTPIQIWIVLTMTCAL